MAAGLYSEYKSNEQITLAAPRLEAGVIMNADTDTGTHQRGVEGGVLHGDGGVGAGRLVRGGVGGGVHAAAQPRHAAAQPRVACHRKLQ